MLVSHLYFGFKGDKVRVLCVSRATEMLGRNNRCQWREKCADFQAGKRDSLRLRLE